VEPIPVVGFLVPEHDRIVPNGFTLVDQKMTRGLPHVIALDKSTSVTVVLPSGLARAWRDADSALVVSSSEAEQAPSVPEAADDVARPPLRLGIDRNGTVLGTIPLAAGLRQVVPRDGGSGAAIELVVLGWELRAGTVRGAGDFGSRVTLAWRIADRASAEFTPPPINANLARRLAQMNAETTVRSRRR